MRIFHLVVLLGILVTATIAASPAFAASAQSGDGRATTSKIDVAGSSTNRTASNSTTANDIVVRAAQYPTGGPGYSPMGAGPYAVSAYQGDWTSPWYAGSVGSYYPGYTYVGYAWPNYYASIYHPSYYSALYAQILYSSPNSYSSFGSYGGYRYGVLPWNRWY